MSTNDTIAVRLLEPAASGDAGLVEQLTGLINDVYVDRRERALARRGHAHDGVRARRADRGRGRSRSPTRDGADRRQRPHP